MATLSEAQAVKSLNESSGKGRFVFKTISERISEINIDVYRSMDPSKAEPSKGSTFFRDCLVEYRELNTAEDFISFYEEIFPLIQTLPQIILQKDLIISSLLSRLKMEGRLSHEPILRLVAALSRDLLEDFVPFLQRISDSFLSLLESGADRVPEIIEQICTSWSYMMMYLQKYLAKDVCHVLSVTANLRYYSRDYVREFMAESVSFILRKTPIQELKKGISKVYNEVVEEPSDSRKSGAAALLSHAVRITSSRLHSNAEKKWIAVLVDNSSFDIGEQSGPGLVLDVLVLTFQRLHVKLDPPGLISIWNCLCLNITDCAKSRNFTHLIRLLTLLRVTVKNDDTLKISDYQPVVELVGLLVEDFVMPHLNVEITDEASDVISVVLRLIFCVFDGLSNLKCLTALGQKWAPIFELKHRSLLDLIEDLLKKDPCVVDVFGAYIMSALNNLIELYESEVILLLVHICEKFEKTCNFLGASSKELLRIHACLEKKINDVVEGNCCASQFQYNRLAVFWGVIRCYPHFANAQDNPLLLMQLINAVEKLMMNAEFAALPENTWHSLIGAALSSYHKLVGSKTGSYGEASMPEFLDLAKRYRLSPQILSAVADVLDLTYGSVMQEDAICQYLPEPLYALDMFVDNLCHANKEIRVSTLRILCHYEPLRHTQKPDVSETSHVLDLLRSVEATPLSVTSRFRSITILETSLSAHRVAEQYLPIVLNGVIGMLYNRFSKLWVPASACLEVLLREYPNMLWDRFVQFLDQCQCTFLKPHDHDKGSSGNDSSDGLVARFNSVVFSSFDSTPSATILCLLIQSLQKVPFLAQSHSQQLVSLFLKFLGYNVDELRSIASRAVDYKGKEWKNILKEWLNLFRLLHNPKASCEIQFLKDVLQYRLLEENDTDLQMKVLECLLNWRDDFLLPYSENLKNLISPKSLSNELTKWSLSRDSMNAIDDRHRGYVVPIVIRTLIPKVRNMKMLGSQKNVSAHHRKAVLRFLTQLDVDELPLFFFLLIKPLLTSPHVDDETSQSLWTLAVCSHGISSNALKHLTIDTIKALSWKKIYGFLHVVEDILSVFDELHLNPYLELLTNSIGQILSSCGNYLSRDAKVDECDENTKNRITERMDLKQFKDLRSLCLRIIHQFLIKYDDHDFGATFWQMFFMSVNPLIKNFKQEGASSEKPSSLFHSFLVMSKSHKLAPLLFTEGNLVPDIFSILTVRSASKPILSCVLKFAKNLLKLDSEVDSPIKDLLHPYLNVLTCSLHSIFISDNATTRNLVKFPGKTEFSIFKLLSKYVKEPSEAIIFVDMLLPVLSKTSKHTDTCVDVLQILQELVELVGSGCTGRILKSITPLLISADPVVRTSICDVLDTLAANDSSVEILAQYLRELNRTSDMDMEMDDMDYQNVNGLNCQISVEFFYTIPEEHVLVILAHCINGMSSTESTIRQSALGILCTFVEFCSSILDETIHSVSVWSDSNVKHIVKNFLLKHMGHGMDKDTPVLRVWIELFKEMVTKIPKVANLESYMALCSDDKEQDFFSNIVHLQKHRRARALSRFKDVFSSGESEVVTNKVFVPLLFRMMFELQDGKDENIRSACIAALASISGGMKWNQYYALLNRCFRDLTLKPEKQKILLRLICSILDRYHFPEVDEKKVKKQVSGDNPDPYVIDVVSSSACIKSADSTELSDTQMCLQKKFLPMVQKLLTSDSDKINVTVSLVALKLLKLLPAEIMDSQLPTIVHRISNFLKNRLESVRDEARTALAACLKELGIEYLQFVVKVLKGTLKRGYELHVLGYTLNFIMSKFLIHPMCGKLDYCLEDLLSVVENDILGGVSEEKEVDMIASKMKETRKQKSFETLKLIAQSITFKTHVLKLFSPVTNHINKLLTQKVKSKLENMLNNIAAGIECNPSVDQTELFTFTYGLIEDGIADEDRSFSDDVGATRSNRLVKVDCRYSHLMTAFALELMQNYMKKLKLNKEDEHLLSLLDPFVPKLDRCLSSKYETVIVAAIRCLSMLVRLPLPSLQGKADEIKKSLLKIVEGSVKANSQLTESCIKLLTILLRSTRVTIAAPQLRNLLQFPLFLDLEKDPSVVALSLLKAIVHRTLGLGLDEIVKCVKIAARLMVRSQQEQIRKKSSEILLQFLLGYRLSKTMLQESIQSLYGDLSYEHSTGREAVLEMLHAIIKKFPQNIVDEHSRMMFMHLVHSLANDEDSKVRSMTAAALKCLIRHTSPNLVELNITDTLSWYTDSEKRELWGAAAQVLGLHVEVMGKAFQKYLRIILSQTRTILQSAATALTSEQKNLSQETVPLWRESYYSLVMFEKFLHQFKNLFLDKDCEDIWEIIFQFLLHPHVWVRTISSRILSQYFAFATDDSKTGSELSKQKFFLMKPSKLFHASVSFCSQLQAPLTDDAAGALILQNLVFTICGLHSILKSEECADPARYWSNLDLEEQEIFTKAFGVLDQRKGMRFLTHCTSEFGQQSKHRHPFISFLLQRMGKIAFQTEGPQMKIVFNCFKLISPRLLSDNGVDDDPNSYAYLMLLPVYRVQEGYTGTVITDDMKELAQEVSDSIRRDMIGKAHEASESIKVGVPNNYDRVINQIRKSLKVKRDKRKQEVKIMAVVNPKRNAKRKLRIAEKHKANKKRKFSSMKMGRCVR